MVATFQFSIRVMIRKYNKTYTEQELNDYIASLEINENIDFKIRQLGYINASAYKGYGELTDEQASYNAMVYKAKDEALFLLADYANISYNNGVAYFELTNGIQVSFHIKDWESKCFTKFYLKRNEKVEWCGVEKSYEYTDIDEYIKACNEAKMRKAEDKRRKTEVICTIHEAIVKYLRNGNRRKALKLDMSLDAIKSTVPTNLFSLGLLGVLQFTYKMNVIESEVCENGIMRMVDEDTRKHYYTYRKNNYE